ncbi:hypothetical protein AVEN_35754-1 [Araneus ventricosus]|uniref:Uncharacterized protein n=1 Tax=Araneus ventricosus TaxID=182803 RepID=A0A4Y2FJ98_ARAVE|nr:hypothetical protein AVEN_35754-1 [Araneus ventricosus]
MSTSDKIVVLTLVPNNFTQNEICEKFSCSRYQVLQANRINLIQISTPKISRERLDSMKAKHILQYLFSSDSVQDVAYRTTLLQFKGDKLRVPQTVLTVLKSHAILLYKQYCSINGYTPLSDSILFKIIKEIKLKHMKSLSGLDNVIVEGLDSITNLLGMANKIFEPSELKQVSLKIEKALLYLKLDHKLHYSSDSYQGIASHCPLFAISDPNDVGFHQICENYNDHSLICPECMDILNCYIS